MAILFQGPNSVSRISTEQNLSAFTSISGTLSIALWIYPTGNSPTNVGIIGVNGQQTPTTNLGPRISINYNTNRFMGCITQSGVNNNNNNTSSLVAVSLNTWSLVAISVGSFGNRIYVNSVTPGTVAGANPGAVPKSNYDRFFLGSVNFLATGIANNFPGAIGEAGLWNAAFTTQDLNSMLSNISFKDIRTQNLVCYTPNYNANGFYEYNKNLPLLFKVGVNDFPHHRIYL
jgi:hypothetical protein